MADSAECSAVLAATNGKLTAVIGEMKAFRTFAGEAAGFVGVLNTGGGMIFLILAELSADFAECSAILADTNGGMIFLSFNGDTLLGLVILTLRGPSDCSGGLVKIDLLGPVVSEKRKKKFFFVKSTFVKCFENTVRKAIIPFFVKNFVKATF